jgi:tRNA (cmo5U34)-methyltransferase
MTKSTIEQIRQRFDKDVERFSNLETGQSATIDAPLVLDLIAKAANAANPDAKQLLDIGCGAGNYTLKLLQSLPITEVTLIDLSQPMLQRARQRISAVTPARLNLHQLDIRAFACGNQQYDVVVAAAVLHHLRSDDEWRAVFTKIHRSLKPGGSFWVSDLVHHSNPAVQAMMWERYGDYWCSSKVKTTASRCLLTSSRRIHPDLCCFNSICSEKLDLKRLRFSIRTAVSQPLAPSNRGAGRTRVPS